MNDFWDNLKPDTTAKQPAKLTDLRTLRAGIPQKTRGIATLNGFLIENLRGPAMKLGCTVVSGHTAELPIITARVKRVELYYNQFLHNPSMFGGVRNAPELPENVNLCPRGTVPPPVGCLVFLGESSLDCATIEFVSGARVMGDLKCVKRFVKGRKFSILNRWNDFICMELA
ncbi:MAG: hypothetical protein GY794_16260 [bacterium]|nr:hypothetical protein [bacterium]